MLDKEINFISDFSLNKVKMLGSFFTFEKLKKSDIHPAIIQYISAHLDFLIYEDRKKILERSAFDYTGNQIAGYFTYITEEIKKNKRLTFEDVKTLVLQAVSFNANFLISPKWSLSRLVFERKDEVAIEEVKLVLNYPYYYDFLKSIFTAYLNKRHVFTITRDEFENLFDKIDREIFAIQPTQFIENTLFDFADFFNIGGVSKTKLPLFAVEAFLKEKNLSDYIFRLKRALPLEPKPKYDLAELKAILLSSSPLEKQVILQSRTEETTVEEDTALIEEEQLVEQSVEQEIEEAEIDFKKEEQNIDELFEIQQDELAEANSNHEEINEPVLDDLTKIENFLLANNEDTVNEIIDYIEANETPDEITEDFEEEVKEIEQQDEEPAEEQTDEEINRQVEDAEILKPDEMLSELMKDADEPELSDELEIEQELIPLPEIEEPLAADEQNSRMSPEDEIMSLLEEIEGNSPLADFNKTTVKQEPEEEFETEELPAETNDMVSPDTGILNSAAEDEKTEAVEKADRGGIKKDITDLISEKEASKIISSVFKDDNVDFIITLGKISNCDTFEEGTEILKSIFVANKIDPYSRDAIKLTNLVAEYFNL